MYIQRGVVVLGAGLRVYRTISIGFGDVPASVPAGKLMCMYPCLGGQLPVGMRVFVPVAIFNIYG